MEQNQFINWDAWGVGDIDYHQAKVNESQKASYEEWTKDKSPEKMSELIKNFSKLINSEVGRYQGTLDPKILANYAKKYTIDAVKNFDPSKEVQLSTHIVNNLKRLHRLNYQNVQGLHTPEEFQRQMKRFLTAKNELIEEGNVEPTDNQIAEYMGVSPNLINRMRGQIKTEISPRAMTYDPVFHEISPEEDALDYVYHDLPDQHKKVLEMRMGYGGSPKYDTPEISKRLNLSPIRITQISDSISKKLKGSLGHS